MLPQQVIDIVDDDDDESTTIQQHASSSIHNNNNFSTLNGHLVSSSNGESSRSRFAGAFSIDDSFSGDNDALSPYTPSKRKLEEIKSFEEPTSEDDDDVYGDVNLDQLIMNYEKTKSASSSSSENSSSYFVTGSNMFGMLGLGNPVSDSAKISSFTRLNNPAIDPSQVKFLACGHYHTILLTKENQLYACGKNNYGQLGMGNLTKVVNIFKFVDSSLNGMPKELITDIKCGRYHTMFITNQPNDNVWVCGKNKTGQMSLPSMNIYPSPQRLITQFSGKVLFASCGSEYTFIKTTDHIYACGDNSRGQCGVGIELPQIKKFTVVRDPLFIRQDIVQIECGEFHTLFLTASGEIWGAGTTVNGQLGLDPVVLGKQNLYSPTKIPVSNNEPIKSISCGFHHSAFLTKTGKIFICGRNGDGQLATGETVPRLFSFTHIPLSASSLGHHFVQDLYCYSYYSIAITDKREMFLTGSNKCGQLGCLETPKIEKFSRTFKHRVMNVYCGRDTLMVEAENKEYTEAVHEDTLGKLLDFDNEDIMSLLDSYIICSDDKQYPILYDFVMARFPFFEAFSKDVSGVPSLERPSKKRKSRGESSIRIIDLSSISTLSSKSVLKILKYIYTDVLDDFGTTIQEDLDVILWIAEKSNKDFSSGPPSISNIARYVKLVLQNTLSGITNGTVVKTLSALQLFKNHPLIESIYRHCIALIRKIEKTYTINEIKDYNDLSKEALIEALTAGENYHCLGSSDVSIPPSTFSEDMESLYAKTQTTNSGDVKLVLSKSTTIHAHKAILAVKCDFFRVKFTSGMCDMDSFDISDDSEEEDKEEVQAHISFIKYLYTNQVLLNGSNAVSFLTKWNFYSMDINHQISLRCQSIIIEGLTESNVLEFQKSFFFDRSSPYHHLRKACVQALISHWPAINQRYTKKQIQDHMTFDQYIKITQAFLKLQAKTNNTV
ncbi:alpha-tubulin suppressor domain-containing protein [Naegleria gruberi]|uniref:Alpha-tubulin suppressor domain-containing protein n=1 Tax=Naegleria gruberi TaxID=5762 RepID=D2W0T0_NAEGR|nr:alpha-tubulin suppressor domain-containing protein [Naegleria gruberi]EFC37391.1 alpha-tubulin suppressor domain-containing protein [Naegleria gruberi]|eukprot:XP_002670135.1 alpha-tubulin suppressor domain-containing protein [Naegleria gruberi strain NEG-M]